MFLGYFYTVYYVERVVDYIFKTGLPVNVEHVVDCIFKTGLEHVGHLLVLNA